MLSLCGCLYDTPIQLLVCISMSVIFVAWCWEETICLWVQVDDNMVNRRVASSMLLRYGATVVSVNGGVEALTAVRKQEPGEEIDLVLMDIQMPEVWAMV